MQLAKKFQHWLPASQAMQKLKSVNIWEFLEGIQKYSHVTETVFFFWPELYDPEISYSHYNVLPLKHRAHWQYDVII
jgi:hypothetical protein